MSEPENINKGESVPRESARRLAINFTIGREIRAEFFFSISLCSFALIFVAFKGRVFVPEIRDTVTGAPQLPLYL